MANRQKSEAAAKPVIAAIKAKFNVDVDTRWTDEGLVVSYKVVTGSDGDNPYVMSPQNLSKVIDPFFKQYRDKGWTFTQPSGGKFMIAVNENLDEAGRVFQTGHRYPPRHPRDGVERARAFDRVNKRTGDRPDRSMFPIDETYTAIDGSNEGDYIQVLVMKNTGVNDYYGINVLFMSDGKIESSTADDTSDDQWREDKEEIIKVAREWFGPAKIRAFVARGGDAERRKPDDYDNGYNDYHGYHDPKTNEGKITFKQFMLGEAAPKFIKVKEPGWYVVDHMDKAVAGPMSETGAREEADEMNAGKTGGDIPAYDVTYFTDFEIRRMNEALTLVVDNTKKKKTANRFPDAIKAGDKFQVTDNDDKPTGAVLTAKADAKTTANGTVKIETDKGVKSFDDMDFVVMVNEDIADMAWAEEMAKDARFKGKVDLKSTTNVPYSEADLMISRLKNAKHKIKSTRPKGVISHKDHPNKGMSFDFAGGDEGIALVKFWK